MPKRQYQPQPGSKVSWMGYRTPMMGHEDLQRIEQRDAMAGMPLHASPCASFERVCLQHLADLSGLAHKYLPDDSGPYTADDLVQDTLFKAYYAWGTAHDTVEDPGAWLCTILLNTFRTYSTRQQLLREKLKTLNLRKEYHWVMGSERSDYDDAESVLDLHEGIAALDALLEQFPPSYRQILVSHVLLHWTYEECAQALHITVNNVRTRLHRAYSRFQQIVRANQISDEQLRQWLVVYEDEDLKRS